ncbi:MAG: alpha-amylase [Calditrichaeota bacterium]|nr:alpha-amylase [Calditrichota bacterium]
MMSRLPVSASARKQLQLAGFEFSEDGHWILSDLRQIRKWVHRLQKMGMVDTQTFHAAEVNGIALLHDVFHHLFERYRSEIQGDVLQAALKYLQSQISQSRLREMMRTFLQEFPPPSIVRGEIEAEAFLSRKIHKGLTGQEWILEELILLYLANQNPALQPYRLLFDDHSLRCIPEYETLRDQLFQFFENRPPFGPRKQNFLEMLETPAKVAPHSVADQLRYVVENWADWLPEDLSRLLKGLDFIEEERKVRWAPGMGPGPVQVPTYQDEAPERFSPDREWMPNLILLAKSTFVWLDQLSKKYGRTIQRLDQIPDEELDQLASWGFTGLWLIGIWERSRASKKIKQLCGNPEAEASAYAIYDYVVNPELGGEEALEDLQQHCWQRGIRLASDMVPNHTGIDARWVMEHPDWFIQTATPPFPNYTFNGPNLSDDPNIGIYIEDHYFDKTDAAVVFKRVDFRTGEVRYIYHGNDGTSIPWNDTAQLNYLLPEVREAVIQKILEVARRFPIIRFDAAMTLTKKHFQRLWFPEPGQGGDIPSRAEFAMTKEEFDRHMPNEFWREVVDRVAQEAPDTLLLAEAFWLMESYFVRTLGMHRVYNSAFMNMLKNEENAKYRELIKNTLAYDPQILKRYVNFMNNPDEETAVVQFGKGDKYFGVCTLMVTLPGLPMFGHGQVEGFREKYGMEFRRAYLDETPDAELIARHEREIFPLMRQRHRFADVTYFQLYDVVADSGDVQENIFAFSNGAPGEETLVVYNNSLQPGAGWIRYSVPRAEKTPEGHTRLQSIPLAEALRIQRQDNYFTIFRDAISGLYFIRNNVELHDKGLFVSLKGYEYHVFMEFQQVEDNRWGHFAELHRQLAGQGVADIQRAVQEILYRGIRQYGRELVAALTPLVRSLWQEALPPVERLSPLLRTIGTELQTIGQHQLDGERWEQAVAARWQAWQQWHTLRARLKGIRVRKAITALKFIEELGQEQSPGVWLAFLLETVLAPLAEQLQYATIPERWEFLMDALGILAAVEEVLPQQGFAPEDVVESQALLTIIPHLPLLTGSPSAGEPLPHQQLLQMLSLPEIQEYLKVNEYQGNVWFNKERYETLVLAIFFRTLMARLQQSLPPTEFAHQLKQDYRIVETWFKAEQSSGYLLEKLKQYLERLGQKYR